MKYILVFLMMLGSPAFAVEPGEMLDDPVLEERARVLSKGLRCPVCRNENIDDSNAALAADMRVLLRERLTMGDSDEEVLQFFVSRYGEFILLKPTFSMTNLLLWLTGPLAILLGGGGALYYVRTRPKKEQDEELDPDEAEKLASLLQD